MANRVVLFLLILLTGIFRLPGLIIGLIAVFLRLALTRSFGLPYLWPLIPLDLKALPIIFLRRPIPIQMYRPRWLRTKDSDRTEK